jgi:uncharacterized SAM-binding protein YcdF (DUF218 family)
MPAPRTAIVVPGHGSVAADGVHRITPRCLGLVREAERLAARLGPELVVFSGWSSTGGVPEAEQMRDAWRGPDVELVVEPTARVTAENASRTLALLLARGIEAAVVVCTPLHLPRARLFFRRLYREHGVAVRFHVARNAPSPRALAWELAALAVAPAQLRAARAELRRRESR